MPGQTQMALLQAVRRELAQALGDRLDTIILFGSHARGEAHPESDIDMLVVVRGEFDYGELLHRTSPGLAALSLQNDVVISRAFADLATFVTLAGAHVAANGMLVAMKGVHPVDEIAHLPPEFTVIAAPKVDVPGLDAARHLVIMRRTT